MATVLDLDVAQLIEQVFRPRPATGSTMAPSVQSGCNSFITVPTSGHAVEIAFRERTPTAPVAKFTTLADEWRRDTRFLSSLSAKVTHPAYLAIIGMGMAALPLIFQDLQRTRSHWLVALHAITLDDPAPPGATFGEAVEAWLAWGRQRGHL